MLPVHSFLNIMEFGENTMLCHPRNLEINTNLGDLAEKILTDLITISSEMPICYEEKGYCVATLETCVDTDSLIRPNKLDAFQEHFGNVIALDFTYSHSHCHFITDMPKVDKKNVCLTFVTTLASAVGLTKNLSLNDDLNVRLMVASNEIVVFDVTSHLKDLVVCSRTPRMLARKVIDHQLLVELTDTQVLLDGIFQLLGMENTHTLLSDCLGKPFVAGSCSASEKENMLICITEKFTAKREKRSTILEFLFSNCVWGVDVPMP